MFTKRKFRRTAELGIAVSAVLAITLVGCGGSKSSASAGAAIVNSSAMSAFLADAKAGNTWEWSANQMMNASAVVVSTSARARKSTLVPTATANTYTVSKASYSINLSLYLPSGAWALQANVPAASGVTDTIYNLTAAGWVVDSGVTTAVSNGTSFNITGQSTTMTPSTTDLFGKPVVCTSPMSSDPVGPATNNRPAITSATCAVPTSYPAGAVLYTQTNVQSADLYYLWSQTGVKATTQTLTDSAGIALTALPAAGATFCVGTAGFDTAGIAYSYGQVYVPIAGAVVGADNYGVRYAPSCAAADITAAVNAGALGQQTVLLAYKATGLGGVTVLTEKTTQVGNSLTYILAFNAAKFMTGSMQAAGTNIWYEVNKLAANAQLTAHGIPVLP